MKRIFTICCLILLLSESYSQNTAISENAQWVIHYQIGFPPIEWYSYFKTNGDTLINSSMYKKLYSMPVHQNGSYSFVPDGSLVYKYAYRNDGNNRAYIIPADSISESLWYDFNLNIGDTLDRFNTWYSYQSDFYTDTIKVVEIDSVRFCQSGSWYKIIRFNTMQMPSLVQGVGFVGDLINYNWEYFEAGVSPVFFAENQECPIILVGVEEQESSDSWSLFPNPTSHQLNISLPDYSSGIRSAQIKDLSGRILVNYSHVSNGILNFDLPDGYYFLELNRDEEIYVQKFQIIR